MPIKTLSDNAVESIRQMKRDVERLKGERRARTDRKTLAHSDQIIDCVITDEGPDEEPDYADERYWVKEAQIANVVDDETEAVDWEPTEDAVAFTATNDAEDGTHDLPTDETAHVEIRSRGNKHANQTDMFFFVASP